MFRNRKQHIRKKIVVVDEDNEEFISNSKDVQVSITSVKSPISNNNENSLYSIQTSGNEAPEEANPSIIIKPRQKPKKPKKSLISFDQDDEEPEETSFKITKTKASLKLSKNKNSAGKIAIIDDDALNLNNSNLSTINNNSRSYDTNELNNLKKLATNNGGSSNKNFNNSTNEVEDLTRSKFPLEFENIPNLKKSKDSLLNQDFIGFNQGENTNIGLTIIDDEEDFKIDENPETPKEFNNNEEDTQSQQSLYSSEDEEVKRWELGQIQRASNSQNKKIIEKLKTSIGPPQHPGTKVIPLPDFRAVKLNWQGVRDISEVRLKLSKDSKEEIDRNLNNMKSMINGINERITDIDNKLKTLSL